MCLVRGLPTWFSLWRSLMGLLFVLAHGSVKLPGTVNHDFHHELRMNQVKYIGVVPS